MKITSYILIYPNPLTGAVEVVVNSECDTFERAELLLFDRKANGDAFPQERVAGVYS